MINWDNLLVKNKGKVIFSDYDCYWWGRTTTGQALYMDWNNFVTTREIIEYDMKLRESVKQREQMKVELAELEKRRKDIFWDAEYTMFSTGIKYFNTCSEYWLYKLEREYIKAENEYLNSQN